MLLCSSVVRAYASVQKRWVQHPVETPTSITPIVLLELKMFGSLSMHNKILHMKLSQRHNFFELLQQCIGSLPMHFLKSTRPLPREQIRSLFTVHLHVLRQNKTYYL